MKYEVRCECGKPFSVTGADAGTTLKCGCGRTVEVPPLHILRQEAGQLSISPELVLAGMLARGELPDTPDCEVCSRPTGGTMWTELVSKAPEEPKEAEEVALGCFLGIVSGLTDLILKPEPKRPPGYDVWFRIPIRCCETCARTLKDAKCREILRRHQLSTALLDKWPQLLVWRVKK